jgi:hypothetical protein
MTNRGPESRVYRRSDLLPYVVGALLAPVFVVAMVVDITGHPQPGYGLALSLVLSVGGLCIAYFAGAAATFTVLPDSIRVANPFVLYEVPRHLFEGFDTLENVAVRMLVQGYRPITVQAVLPGLTAAHSRRRLLRNLRVLESCLDEVPPQPSFGETKKRLRLGNIAVVAMAFVGFFAVAWYVVAR